MLTEKRQKEILRFLDEKGSVTVQELTERLDASESTIRRDLAVLHQCSRQGVWRSSAGRIQNQHPGREGGS